jgi:hypothetical protein
VAMRTEDPAEHVGGVTNVDLDALEPTLEEPAKRISADERRFGGPSLRQFAPAVPPAGA